MERWTRWQLVLAWVRLCAILASSAVGVAFLSVCAWRRMRG